jgi:hypothetical protein
MNTQDIEFFLRREMNSLSLEDLREFAMEMGVEVSPEMSRFEIEEECVATEIYAFVH